MTRRQLRWKGVAAALGTVVLLALMVLGQAPATRPQPTIPEGPRRPG